MIKVKFLFICHTHVYYQSRLQLQELETSLILSNNIFYLSNMHSSNDRFGIPSFGYVFTTITIHNSYKTFLIAIDTHIIHIKQSNTTISPIHIIPISYIHISSSMFSPYQEVHEDNWYSETSYIQEVLTHNVWREFPTGTRGETSLVTCGM